MSANPLKPSQIGPLNYLFGTNVEDSITAYAGGGQTSVYKLSAQISRVTTVATAADSVALPKINLLPNQPGYQGFMAFVVNAGANDMQVFGQTPDTINGTATGTGVSVPAGMGALFFAFSYTQSTNVGNWVGILGDASALANLVVSGNLTVDGTSTLTGGIVGVTTNSNAAAGNVGEYVTATVVAGSAVSLTTATAANITSISLTAGDWDISGVIDFLPASSTSITELIASVSLTTATVSGQPGGSGLGTDPTITINTAANVAAALRAVAIPPVRLSIAATTTVYLVAEGAFSVSTLTGYGTIRARRVR